MSIKRTYWTKQEIDILCAMYSNTKAACIQDILTRVNLCLMRTRFILKKYIISVPWHRI